MSVNSEANFCRNAYWKTLYTDKSDILDFVKDHPQFTYGNTGFSKFANAYKSKGWFARKIIALPAAVWSGGVKTTYHVAKLILTSFGVLIRNAVIHGSPTKQDIRYLKAQGFCIARDLQESFGWLLTLFHDKCGQYHVQESQCHRLCYQHFVNPKTYIQAPQTQTNTQKQPGKTENPKDSSNPVQSNAAHDFINYMETALDAEVARMAPLVPQPYKSYVLIAKRYLTLDLLDKAHDILKKLVDTSHKEGLANGIRLSFPTSEEKEIRENLVRAYIKLGNRDQAKKILKECKHPSSNYLYLDVAQSYFNDNHLEEAYNAINQAGCGGTSRTQEQRDFIFKLSEHCFQAGDRKKAVKFVQANYEPIDQPKVDRFLINVAESYFQEDNLKDAVETIMEIGTASYNEEAGKDLFLEKVAKNYITVKNDLVQAKEVIAKIVDPIGKAKSMAILAESYWKQNDLETAANLLWTIPISIIQKCGCRTIIAPIVSDYKQKGTSDNIKTYFGHFHLQW